ncbi:MAG: hypothetical protein A3E83_07560 [Gammaproteobacteria bacterium RIFCSPHIGHO2_12_FULL_41_20]|nr:MAG: hypothetical protein A3E83_07560 [Gammaproteobacteria bacterium RIFCSPHIGHO2_12_FULL_41_20]
MTYSRALSESNIVSNLQQLIEQVPQSRKEHLLRQLVNTLKPNNILPNDISRLEPCILQLDLQARRRIFSVVLLSFSNQKVLQDIATALYMAMTMDSNNDLTMHYPDDFSIARCASDDWLVISTAMRAFHLVALHVCPGNQLESCEESRWLALLSNIRDAAATLKEIAITGDTLGRLHPVRRHQLLREINNGRREF